MTSHWICPKTLGRKSAIIALKRIKGNHLSTVLSSAIFEILEEFDILSKVNKIVTDNGSNFVKALKPVDENEDIITDQNVRVINLTRILRDAAGEHTNIPLHQRCAAHTLNLCMTSDVQHALKHAIKNIDETEEGDEGEPENIFNDDDFEPDVSIIDSALRYHNLNTSIFKKCKNIWNKQSKSSVVGDLIKEKLGVYLKVPNDTRWNSLLYAVQHLLTFISEKPAEIKAICSKLKIDYFTATEISFLQEYVSVNISALNMLSSVFAYCILKFQYYY